MCGHTHPLGTSCPSCSLPLLLPLGLVKVVMLPVGVLLLQLVLVPCAFGQEEHVAAG